MTFEVSTESQILSTGEPERSTFMKLTAFVTFRRFQRGVLQPTTILTMKTWLPALSPGGTYRQPCYRFLNTRFTAILLNPFCFIPIHTTCDLSELFPSRTKLFSVFIFHSFVFFFYFFYLLLTLIRYFARFLLAFITVNRSSYRTNECSH